ncbi:ATP-dependent helicase HrpB [bacterium]|nr:ATP-dependent helicase HrpB [bacterium]
MVRLPIDAHLPEILAALEKKTALLLEAAPGTGKTTRVPAALLDAPWRKDREIWVLEPRRLAAKLAARRVADERGEKAGETVGYQFRFENVGGPRTRLRFLTEGMVLRHLLSDPHLSKVAAVVLDEFHERHLQGDLALALLRTLQSRRPDLRLIVMSATLRSERLLTYLDSPVHLKIGAPHFPLEVRHYPLEAGAYLDKAIARTVSQLQKEDQRGDILVFLPGMADIRRAEQALAPIAREQGIALHSLHGELSKEEQEAAVTPGPRRKIVLSTNIAESSLTIEGVNTVIDSGLHRMNTASSWSGLPTLKTRPISRASATQRAGRAARTGPGLCIRLYSQGDLDMRPPEDPAEVLRADLSQTLLEIKAYGISDEGAFAWFEPPPDTSLDRSRALLFQLGALEASGTGAALTETGKKMARFPAHPRVAKLLLEAQMLGCTQPAVALAALLSESDLEYLDALEAVKRQSIPERSRRRFEQILEESGARRTNEPTLARAALAAFADRVARKKPGSRNELVLCGGGTLQTDDLGAFGSAELFAVIDAREHQMPRQTRAVLRASALVALETEWLLEVEPSPLVQEEALEWDSARSRVTARSRLRYDQLVLEEQDGTVTDYPEALEVLLRQGLGLGAEKRAGFTTSQWIEGLLPVASRETLESVFSRQALAEQAGKTGPGTEALLQQALLGKTSLQELKDLDWEQALLPVAVFGRFPSHVTLPGGRQVRIQYALGRPPWIESRLQDFFGMRQGPTLLDGKLPLTLHLLAPNQRAVQVTTDLEGFWKKTYPTVRRELSRNYPRHSWPEDPLTAQPPPPRGRR